MHDGFQVRLHRGVADAEHIGDGQGPHPVHLRPQRQLRPGDVPLLLHALCDFPHQFVGCAAVRSVGGVCVGQCVQRNVYNNSITFMDFLAAS